MTFGVREVDPRLSRAQPSYVSWARFDHALLRVPVGGASIHKFATAQVSRTLATLLGGGIPAGFAVEA